MLEQGERILRVALQQDELAVRLSSLPDSNAMTEDEQARLKTLAQKQAELRDELEDAGRALREAAEQAGEALPRMSSGALEVADKIDSLRIVPTQTAAGKAALAGNGPLAYQAAREAADKLDSLLSDVNQSQMQASNDLDGCFNLPRQNIQNMMQQMAAGRQLPGLGMQGGSGAGMSGSMARLSMMGPAIPGQANSASQSRQNRRDGRNAAGRSPNIDQDLIDQAEVIHADPSEEDTVSAVRLLGLTGQYREQAEAYFKRIAEEN